MDWSGPAQSGKTVVGARNRPTCQPKSVADLFMYTPAVPFVPSHYHTPQLGGLHQTASSHHPSSPSSNAMDHARLNPDFHSPEWRWPAWRFGLSLKDLFGTLYTQYNTVSIPILDPVAFHHDVSEICTIATTASELHALLAERRDERLSELRKCWLSVAEQIASRPSLLDPTPSAPETPESTMAAMKWCAFLRFSREFSFDALNQYFALFTHGHDCPENKTIGVPDPRREAREAVANTKRKRSTEDNENTPPTKKTRFSESSGTPPSRRPLAPEGLAQRTPDPSPGSPDEAEAALLTPPGRGLLMDKPRLNYLPQPHTNSVSPSTSSSQPLSKASPSHSNKTLGDGQNQDGDKDWKQQANEDWMQAPEDDHAERMDSGQDHEGGSTQDTLQRRDNSHAGGVKDAQDQAKPPGECTQERNGHHARQRDHGAQTKDRRARQKHLGARTKNHPAAKRGRDAGMGRRPAVASETTDHRGEACSDAARA